MTDQAITYTVAFRSVSDGVIVEREITGICFDVTDGRLTITGPEREYAAVFEPKTWAYILPKVN